MSMLTPPGLEGRQRRQGPSSVRRALIVLAVLVLVGTAAAVAWQQGVFDTSSSGATSSSTTTAGPSSSPSSSPQLSVSPSPRPSDCPSLSASSGGTVVAVKPPAPATIKVNVYNSTDRAGLAAQVATALRTRGFTLGAVANDPLKKTVTAPAEVRSAAGSPAGLTVSLQVQGAVRITDTRRDGSVDLVLGAGYTALQTPAQVKAAVDALATIRPECAA